MLTFIAFKAIKISSLQQWKNKECDFDCLYIGAWLVADRNKGGSCMKERIVKIKSRTNPNPNLSLRVIPGHFATTNSHLNFYIDMTFLKTRQSEAKEVAKAMVGEYVNNTVVDTIVCMDGCEVVAAYLAEELTAAGFMSRNAHKTIYIVTPEFNSNGQMIFRDNLQPEIREKNIILLAASVTTGLTVRKSLDCIRYYGGIIQGISTIFSAVKVIDGFPINTIFTTGDVPGYGSFKPHECPFCKNGDSVEALVNSYGYSALNK